MILAQLFSAIALAGYVILILLTLRQNSSRRLNQAFVIYLAAMAFWQLTALMVSSINDSSAALLWYRLMTAGMGGQFIFYTFFILVFLDNTQPRIIFISGWLVFLALLFSARTDLIIANVVKSPVSDLLVPTFGVLVPLVAVIAYLSLGYSVYRLFQGYKQTKSLLQRNRIKYLLLGSGVIAIGSFSNLAPHLQSFPVDVFANIINAVIITMAIGRHKLLDISLVFRKGVLYSIPTVIIGTVYFLLISLGVWVFHASGHTQIFLALSLAILAALVAQPFYSKAQSLVDRLFFREKYDSSIMLQRLSQNAASMLNLSSLTNMILEEVTQTLHIDKAAFFLKNDQNGEFRQTAQQGLTVGQEIHFRYDHPVVVWLANHENALSRSDIEMHSSFKALWGMERNDLERLGAELFFPIKARNELVGFFVFGSKRSEALFSQDDILTLNTLANQTAVQIANARLYWHLERTHEALKLAHDELEQRVQERTEDLAKANQALQAEIGERMRAEESIQLYTKELERSNQELQQFAYVASHDLQEPLRMVSSYMQLLERRYGEHLHGDAKDFIYFAVDGAKRMQALINDLLAYSRVGTRGKPFDEVDLCKIVEHAQENLRIAIDESRAQIICNQLPTVSGDEMQLTQVFQNLIGNAIKFRGDCPPQVRISETRENGMWHIWIADNGIGIDPQYSERIFQIFQRLHTRDEYPGNGIGLAICKRIIERHGGNIWVNGKLGEGSTFHFTIPAKDGNHE